MVTLQPFPPVMVGAVVPLLDTKMMDYITYGGTAGIELGNDAVKLGVNYNSQFGVTSSAYGVFGTFRYEF